MNKLNLAAIALCTGITFACSPKASMVKGVICDATINTLTVVSEEGDTLSFSTLDAERIVTDGILLDDTAIVYHSGKYKTGMKAQKIVVVPGRRNMVGGDRDKHGCIGSADDTKNVRRINGKWTISQRGKTIYSQEEFQNK